MTIVKRTPAPVTPPEEAQPDAPTPGSDEHTLCRVCGYTASNCVGHSGLLPTVRPHLMVPVSREAFRAAVSAYARNFDFWTRRMKGLAA